MTTSYNENALKKKNQKNKIKKEREQTDAKRKRRSPQTKKKKNEPPPTEKGELRCVFFLFYWTFVGTKPSGRNPDLPVFQSTSRGGFASFQMNRIGRPYENSHVQYHIMGVAM